MVARIDVCPTHRRANPFVLFPSTDAWLVEGLAQYTATLYLERALGRNEHRCQLYAVSGQFAQSFIA